MFIADCRHGGISPLSIGAGALSVLSNCYRSPTPS